MTDDQTALALLRAVFGTADDDFAARDDDTPRLLYADRLDELTGTVVCPQCEGKKDYWVGLGCAQCARCDGVGRVPDGLAARAEFIRVQCEIHWREAGGWKGGSLDPAARLDALRQREDELLSSDTGWALVDGFHTTTRPDSHLFGTGSANGRYGAGLWRRGFVERVECTAAHWLAHADSLYWHAGRRVPCEICGGLAKAERLLGMTPEPADPDCVLCRGEGTLPRPCPPTAQPVAEVRLTELVPPVDLDNDPRGQIPYDFGVAVRHLCDERGIPCPGLHGDRITWPEAFAAIWPGVAFDFPDADYPDVD